jgi:hypothetical protein
LPLNLVHADESLRHLAVLNRSHFRHFIIATTHRGDGRMLGPASLLKEVWEIVPVLLLLLVGGLIAVQSGVRNAASGQGLRQIAGNLSQMLLRILGYVAVLLTLQYCIGLRPSLGW